jgi:hypothetical protein
VTRLDILLAIALFLLVVAAALATSAHATVVLGGGNAAGDCLAVFDVGAPGAAARGRRIRCADGMPCDADGMVDGRCTFAVAVCANSTVSARCALTGVESIRVAHARDDGDPDFDPDFQALQARIDTVVADGASTPDACTVPATITVAIDGPLRRGRCRKGAKRISLTALPLDADARIDRDTIELGCDPSPAGCAARVLFDGTFDRIQRQIFDRSCARSGCHDSQSVEGNLLLEHGAAYGNLVDATPSNAAAALADWRRVAVITPTSGDPARSLLFHKVNGHLPPGFGARMPFGRRRLDPVLIDVIESWIRAGAPATGWVPGTD